MDPHHIDDERAGSLILEDLLTQSQKETERENEDSPKSSEGTLWQCVVECGADHSLSRSTWG
jgi:hypothetical protein